MNNIRIMAHRGIPVLYPENTLISFENAFKHKPEIIETDFRQTKDGVFVIIHDDSVDRTSNGTGLVKDYTYEELLRLDFGNPKSFGDKFKGTKILTLEKAIDFFENTNVEYWLEVKEPDTIKEFCELINRKKPSNRLVFNIWSVNDAKEIGKYSNGYHINNTGILYEYVKASEKETYIKECVKNKITKGSVEFGFFFNMDKKDRFEFIKLCCENNIKLGIWTMDDVYNIAKAVCFNMVMCYNNKYVDFSFDNFTTNNLLLGLKFLGRIKDTLLDLTNFS